MSKKTAKKAAPKKAMIYTEQQEKCRECRECCEYVEYPMTMVSVESLEYFVTRGDQLYIDYKTGVISARVYKPCVHLTKDGCAIYHSRPVTCSSFMCNEKDSTVKEHKEQLCAETIERIYQMINNVRNSKNDLQPSESNQDAGNPGTGKAV